MLTRLEPREIPRVAHLFRFDVSPANNFRNEWGSYLIACNEPCYMLSAINGVDSFVFYVPDRNFFMQMKLSCETQMQVIIRGTNYDPNS